MAKPPRKVEHRTPADRLYRGDYWQAILEAHRQVNPILDRTELWILSAGYGLIPAGKRVKPYSATFASRATDSVWRGASDGDRRETLQQWWRSLPHEQALRELSSSASDAVVLVGGASTSVPSSAISTDCSRALRILIEFRSSAREREALTPCCRSVPASAGSLGGTDSALNARVLALLARKAHEHRFRHEAMARLLNRIEATTPSRPTRRLLSDAQVVDQIGEMRETVSRLSRTTRFGCFGTSGFACEQRRFATIWNSLASETTTATDRPRVTLT